MRMWTIGAIGAIALCSALSLSGCATLEESGDEAVDSANREERDRSIAILLGGIVDIANMRKGSAQAPVTPQIMQSLPTVASRPLSQIPSEQPKIQQTDPVITVASTEGLQTEACPALGSTVASVQANVRCRCAKRGPGFSFHANPDGGACISGKLYYFGCSVKLGKVTCTQL